MEEYAKQLFRQNAGYTCEHCGSAIGHFNVCPLINRTTAEAYSAAEARSATLFDQNVTAGFYRPERFKATMHVPELILTEEDEKFLRDINQAFN